MFFFFWGGGVGYGGLIFGKFLFSGEQSIGGNLGLQVGWASLDNRNSLGELKTLTKDSSTKQLSLTVHGIIFGKAYYRKGEILCVGDFGPLSTVLRDHMKSGLKNTVLIKRGEVEIGVLLS